MVNRKDYTSSEAYIKAVADSVTKKVEQSKQNQSMREVTIKQAKRKNLIKQWLIVLLVVVVVTLLLVVGFLTHDPNSNYTPPNEPPFIYFPVDVFTTNH